MNIVNFRIKPEDSGILNPNVCCLDRNDLKVVWKLVPENYSRLEDSIKYR